jgi:hypothetical protein
MHEVTDRLLRRITRQPVSVGGSTKKDTLSPTKRPDTSAQGLENHGPVHHVENHGRCPIAVCPNKNRCVNQVLMRKTSTLSSRTGLAQEPQVPA